MPECGKEFEFESGDTRIFEVPLPLFERRHFYRSESVLTSAKCKQRFAGNPHTIFGTTTSRMTLMSPIAAEIRSVSPLADVLTTGCRKPRDAGRIIYACNDRRSSTGCRNVY